MQPWAEFYSVLGGAAAALLGLLFVSVSLNPAATLGVGRESARRLAEQAFQNYIAVLLVSLLALIPELNTRLFGVMALSSTALASAWVIVRLIQTITDPGYHEPKVMALRRHLASLIGFSLLIGAALVMAMGKGDQRNLLAAAVIILLISATRVSWELLVRLARPANAPPEA